ncbi:tRNA-dihydrouridine synthase [Candidatus Parcubacteria bacterium]|nr:tRNA-dihydrouridine synthase [Candidatus Parcubacteria bacterium]
MVNLGFWEKLKRPILVLAPLANVTDVAFRSVIAKYGKPDVLWTEFVSADGLFMGGREKLLRDLEFGSGEHPIVAQFFTSKPEMMKKAAALAAELGFDGIDINMGCPDRSVEKQGAGAALIKNPKLAREIIRAAKAGAGNLPVCIKTRTGYNKDELDTWLGELLAEEPAVITIHARTRKEMSKVPARWSDVKRAVEMRDKLGSKTLIFGNGDVVDLDDARKKAKETGADGIMLGRAIFGNPWLFSKDNHVPTTEERLNVLVEHAKLFEKKLGDIKSFAIMKKHFKAYVSGWDGAKELRVKLMEANSSGEVTAIVKEYLSVVEV